MDTEPIAIRHNGIDALVTLTTFIEDGRKIAGIVDLKGTVDHPPKAWMRVVRQTLRDFEQVARDAGCEEFRLAGRKQWARILPDYEPMTDAPQVLNGLRKKL